jgi:hypothetical protein
MARTIGAENMIGRSTGGALVVVMSTSSRLFGCRAAPQVRNFALVWVPSMERPVITLGCDGLVVICERAALVAPLVPGLTANPRGSISFGGNRNSRHGSRVVLDGLRVGVHRVNVSLLRLVEQRIHVFVRHLSSCAQGAE